MTRAALGLGSNVGDRRAHLSRAVAGLWDIAAPVAVSSLYETDPIGPVAQPAFLNAVVVLDAPVGPLELLAHMQQLEVGAGRERRERWGPRTLDLDLLLFGRQQIEYRDLEVPHPELTRRRFVLEPLVEAWPEAVLPDGRPVSGFLTGVADQVVRVVADPSWASDQ